MVDLTYFMFNSDLVAIQESFRAGKETLDTVRDSAIQRFNEVERRVSQPKIFEDGHADDGFNSGVYEITQAEEMQALHCKAFCLMLHHAWERHICNQRNYTKYVALKAYGELLKDGWPIQRNELERLRMVANCVKHDSDELYQKHPEMFVEDRLLYIQSGKKRASFWQDALKIDHNDFDIFLQAVRKSAQKPVEGLPY